MFYYVLHLWKNNDHLLHLQSEPGLEEEALYREDKPHLEFTWDGKRSMARPIQQQSQPGERGLKWGKKLNSQYFQMLHKIPEDYRYNGTHTSASNQSGTVLTDDKEHRFQQWIPQSEPATCTTGAW